MLHRLFESQILKKEEETKPLGSEENKETLLVICEHIGRASTLRMRSIDIQHNPHNPDKEITIEYLSAYDPIEVI